jgi:hypothetical protein
MLIGGGLKYSEADGTTELHDLYRLVSCGEWWTGRQWDRWDLRNCRFGIV